MKKRRLWIAGFLLAISLASCTAYNPSLFQGYDVLSPSAEVRLNPLGFTEDGNLIVNPQFIQWVDELKQEILRLRKKAGKE